MKAVTNMNIDEIARLAGVSKATVSRVLNHSHVVKPETRERVLSIIREHNYIPSETARGLSKGNSDVIGIVFPDLENPFFYGLLKGITNMAKKYHYNVLIFYTDENEEDELEVLRVAKGRDLAGLIVTAVGVANSETNALLTSYEEAGIPVVLLDREVENGTFCSIQSENQEGSYRAVSELIAQGHEKIGLIAGYPWLSPVYERANGYKKALMEAGIPLREEYIIHGDSKSPLAYEGMKKLLALPDPPTAVFTTNNMATLGVLRCLTEQGLALGRDLSLIGFDDIPNFKPIHYGLSVVDRSEELMGETAMEAMMLRLSGKTEEACRLGKIPATLILRGSEKYPFPPG